ncbi:MAG: glycosyltransferase family 4 protein, partial [Elusimicrobia bacterium]|nr:glycosyltransferase family 4 protein [Elusimicrobiota bacterium]
MQKKSKILYLDYPIVIAGGGQKSLLLLLKNIDLSKFEPFVFLPEKSQFAEFLAAEKINCSIVPIWKLFFAIKKLKPMLIHCNAPTLKYTYISAIAAKLLKIPFIWHLRVTQSAGWKDRVIAKLCTKIIVTSDAVKEKILNTGNDYKIVKIHNGVDLNSFYPDVNINNLKKEFNIKEDEFVVGAIGRMDVWKGHSYFVEMAGLLAKKLPNSKFFIVGDGAERINLESKVKDLNFPPGKFFFAGFRNDIPEFVSLFDVLVQPSDVEPFGRTVIEAMASGTPVVATNSGGPKEIIESSVDGFLSPLNSQAFAESVLKLLKDKELYKLISINARKKVEEKYDIVKQTRAIESLYIDLLTKAAVFYKCNICGSTNKKIVEWNEENKVVK